MNFIECLLKRKSLILFLIIGICIIFAAAGFFTAWNSGMNVGLMGNAEQAMITSVRFVEGAPTGDIAKVTVRNAGASSVVIQQGYLMKQKLQTLILKKSL